MAQVQVKCANNCGFRVHDRYFEQKKRFSPGLCPRCNSPISIVKPFTDTVVVGARMVTDPHASNAGEIITKEVASAPAE